MSVPSQRVAATQGYFWVCQYCNAQIVSYPVLKEHQTKWCKVLIAIRQRRERIQRESLAQSRKGTLDEWGLRG